MFCYYIYNLVLLFITLIITLIIILEFINGIREDLCKPKLYDRLLVFKKIKNYYNYMIDIWFKTKN